MGKDKLEQLRCINCKCIPIKLGVDKLCDDCKEKLYQQEANIQEKEMRNGLVD